MEFSVHDDGPGMPPDMLDTVFRRFEPRTNGGRRRGAGLGLSIVKSFVELHGGSVRIETGKDQGTTVICLFPDHADRHPRRGGVARSMTGLIVERFLPDEAGRRRGWARIWRWRCAPATCWRSRAISAPASRRWRAP